MLKLNANTVQDKKTWDKKVIKAPEFDYKEMSKKTRQNPRWLHFGAGNIFRAFIPSSTRFKPSNLPT